ncbi:hypothetical protein H0H92_014730 [Tricholoma furcatifolium]|nr:hypothetical protein H0H92_014730 [Tricholoma furcatifolium]
MSAPFAELLQQLKASAEHLSPEEIEPSYSKDLLSILSTIKAASMDPDNELDRRINSILEDIPRDYIVYSQPINFLDSLATGSGQNSLATRENRAFIRLFGVYDGDPAQWRQTLASASAEQTDWIKLCQESTENEGKLLYTEQILETLSIAHSANAFVCYVLRTIQILKFTITWTSRDTKPGGKSWKHDHIEEAFKHAERQLLAQCAAVGNQSARYQALNKQIQRCRKSYHNAHGKIISSRKDLLWLYRTFGATVLLDRAWDTIDTTRSNKPTNHTRNF